MGSSGGGQPWAVLYSLWVPPSRDTPGDAPPGGLVSDHAGMGPGQLLLRKPRAGAWEFFFSRDNWLVVT